MVSQAQVTQLADLIEREAGFASALEVDSLTTLRETGFDELEEPVARERDRVAELVDRIYSDDEFRQSVERAPRTVLDDWGIPEAAIESVLIVAGAPEEVVERASSDVEAHLLGKKPLTLAAAAAVLGALAFSQEANAGNQLATKVEIKQAAVSAEISAANAPAQARVAIAHARVGSLTKVEITHAVSLKWKGVNVQRLSAQHLTSAFRSR